MAQSLPAHQAPHGGQRISANGRPVKASYEVKVGDQLELRFGERTVKVEVLGINEHAGKADAPALYREML